jgi:hypothetical protein
MYKSCRQNAVLLSCNSAIYSHNNLLTGYCISHSTNFILGKVPPRTGHEGPEGEYRYSSTLSLTSTLDGGGWSTPHPGRFTPGKDTRYPFYRRVGGPQGRSGRARKISPPPGFDPRVGTSASVYLEMKTNSVPENCLFVCFGVLKSWTSS